MCNLGSTYVVGMSFTPEIRVGEKYHCYVHPLFIFLDLNSDHL